MRIIGLDVARAFAILGMMLVNYKIVFTEELVKHVGLSKFISVFEGRAAAVFLILAGIGIALMSKIKDENNRLEEENRIKWTLIKRSIFLFVIGILLYVFFDWSADILHYYGIYISIMTLVMFRKKSTVVWSIVVVLLVTLILQLTLDYTEGWIDFKVYENFFSLKGFLMNTYFNGYHPVFPWISFILIGYLLGQADLSQSSLLKKIKYVSLILAVVTEIFSYLMTISGDEILIYLFDTKPMNPSILYIVAASAWAIFFITNMIQLSDKYKDSRVITTLKNTGQMALTHYIVHSLGVLGLFLIVGQLTYKDEVFVIALSTVVFILMMVYSNYRMIQHKRGPMESLMRKCTS